MKTLLLTIILTQADRNLEIQYIIVGVVALFLLAYLIYALLKPEKF